MERGDIGRERGHRVHQIAQLLVARAELGRVRDDILRQLLLPRARARQRLHEPLPRGLQPLLDCGDLVERRVGALEVLHAVERRLDEELREPRVRGELVVECGHGVRERREAGLAHARDFTPAASAAVVCAAPRQSGNDFVLLLLVGKCAHIPGMRALISATLLATAWLGTAHADGDSLQDLMGPREVALGEAMRGDATGASAIALNPAGLPLNKELVFEGGYGYRQSDQASLLGVSACDSTNAVPGCFFYDYAGSSPAGDLGNAMPASHTTSIAGLALAHTVTPHVLFGVTAKYYHYDTNVMGESDASGFAFDAGLTIRLTELVNLGLAGDNLLATQSSPEMPRAYGGGLSLKPLPMLTLNYDMRWITSGTVHGARYGGGGELFLRSSSGQTGFPIRVGALRDNSLDSTYLSAGLGFSTMSFGVDVGGRKSISGLDETMIIASIRLFGPRLAAPGVE